MSYICDFFILKIVRDWLYFLSSHKRNDSLLEKLDIFLFLKKYVNDDDNNCKQKEYFCFEMYWMYFDEIYHQ